MGRSNSRWPAFTVLALLPLAWGCAHCASPFDYCGPVFNGGCNECVVDARVGSAFYAPGVPPGAAPGDVLLEAVPISPEGVAPSPPDGDTPPGASESPSDTMPEFGPAIPDRQAMDMPALSLRR